ncbi:MAG TPA: methylated-DNA--[protein]-cysteine S-methyltransferase [Pseudonocardiaceae bacterium]|nr:methylated-DNA--[protein]-cysteine S-methyltransferase [Pseudonocardiaceae bacterium]
METTHTVIGSPVGDLTVVARDDAVVGLYFDGQRRRPADVGERAETPLLGQVRQQLDEYFTGGRTTFDLPLRPDGDTFDQRVWALLPAIPYGETRSYGDLARQLGDPGLAQAVGAANGRNPLCVLVPCHRVVGADGSLTGYAGGLDRKRFLLDLETPAETRLF